MPLRTFSLVGCIMPSSLGVNTGPTNQYVLATNEYNLWLKARSLCQGKVFVQHSKVLDGI